MKVENYFQTPIYIFEKPEWVKESIKATNPYIKEAIKLNKPKFYNNKDFGLVHHSKPKVKELKLKKLIDFIGNTAMNILDNQGYNMSLYNLFLNEMWVQEFPKNGGGHHSPHNHWNGHISGFYFLKCSSETSYPVFYDPRSSKSMNMLKQKDDSKLTYSTEQVHFKIKPGTLLFFNSYLTHEFIFDKGIEPFRFIHFNIQATDKNHAI